MGMPLQMETCNLGFTGNGYSAPENRSGHLRKKNVLEPGKDAETTLPNRTDAQTKSDLSVRFVYDQAMADSGLGDLLGDMDDLDSALFGKSSAPKSKPTLGNLDSLFGEVKKPAAKKPTVSFLDSTSSATAPHGPTKSALDVLFAEKPSEGTSSTPSMPTATNPRPSRPQTGSATLGDLFGTSRRERETKAQSTAATPPPPPVTPPQPATPAPEDALRVKRLENEIERLHREIEDLKTRKKDDEEDLEKLWRDKMSRKEQDHLDEMKNLESIHLKQISKLNGEHMEELERLKVTYERQLEAIQQSAGEWRDVSTVVNKVETLSSTINQLADNVTTVTDRSLLEKETTLRIREEQLDNRERRLNQERDQFEEERKKVYELNTRLNELCRGQETVIEQDKYRVREEWNRLNAEKMAFKEDQKFILENIEKQKASFEQSKVAFFHEQHDLLVRVSAERQLLEQEKNDFHGKRAVDVRRLKDEASELQQRAQNILAAENHIEELRRHYDLKTKQLQELEISLMEECLEMENLRNQLSQTRNIATESLAHTYNSAKQPADQNPTPSQNSEVLSRSRNERVSTVLKQHSEFLERYMGQKVAAVAPRPVNFD